MGSAILATAGLMLPVLFPPDAREGFRFTMDSLSQHEYKDRGALPDFEDFDRFMAYKKDTPYTTDAQPLNSTGRAPEDMLSAPKWEAVSGAYVDDPVLRKR